MQITTEYAEAMKMVMDILPKLGETPDQQTRSLAALANYIAATSAPAAPPLVPVASKLPHYPEPADFQAETLIGSIDGEPVLGLADWLDREGKLWRYDVRADLGGLTITTDGSSLTIDATEPGCDERWKVAGIGRLLELAQAGYLPELLTLARRWCE